MGFLETHWAEFLIGGIFLWGWVSIFKITSAKDKSEMAIAELVGKENWSSVEEISIRRQISIDTTLHKNEIGLSVILGLMLILAFKLII